MTRGRGDADRIAQASRTRADRFGTLWPLARCLDLYRVVFARRSHRRVDLERLRSRFLLRLTVGLMPRGFLRSVGPHPRGHPNPPGSSRYTLSNIPSRRLSLPTRRRRRRELRLKFGQKPAFWAVVRTPCPGSKSVQPLLRPSGISPARRALEFFILAASGRHLARCLIPRPEALLAGLHFARNEALLRSPETWDRRPQSQCLGGPDGICG